ncbi:MAG: hypothetical protein WCL00_05965 [Bacteroidota bacterium]
MKNKRSTLKLWLINLLGSSAMIMVILLSTGYVAKAQKNQPVIKIGVYDSRAVVFAYSRSHYFKEHLQKFAKQSDSAEKAKDTVRVKEFSMQAMSYQHLLHQMIFSTGSVHEIMDLIKDQLPELAKKEGVSLIMSKYEVSWKDPSIEVVDLTDQVSMLFKPSDDYKKMAVEISKNAPVPLEELTIEQDMLDLYCKRFGKK